MIRAITGDVRSPAREGHAMTSNLADVHARGFGAPVGFGLKPALLVVDFTCAFTNPSAPLGAAMEREIGEANRLIAAARQRGAPVFFSTISYDDPAREAGVWATKIAGLHALVTGSPGVAQDPRLDVAPGDHVFAKPFASCFFATDLADRLKGLGIDTLVIAGCTTSGCVRASAVDACQHGFRTIVAREATADRLAEAHLQSLADIDLKYGDVRGVDEIIRQLGGKTSDERAA